MSQLLEPNSTAAVEANDLLARYDQESTFFFASPRLTLHGRGQRARLRGPLAGGGAQERLDGLFAEIGAELVAAALPFEADQPAVVFAPERLERAGPLRHDALPAGAAGEADPAGAVRREVPEPAVYLRSVQEALRRFETTPLRKVVLARALELSVEHDIDVGRLLRNLARGNPRGYTFAIDVPDLGGHSLYRPLRLMGASPELLVSRRGTRVFANPIAGTLPRSADPVEDAARAAELQSSVKDQYEHALVVQAVMAALQPYCRTLDVPLTPSLIKTPTLWHLSTEIHGTLRDPATSALQLAQALHPTPAVCGYPRELARAAIHELEPFERGLFTGVIGWTDAAGDGEWAVTIRCAEVEERRVRLFAGAGVVPDSEPAKELAETAAKFLTMLNAMEIGA